MQHLALPVGDQERSRRFYEHWFGFDASAQWYPDGTLIVRDAKGFSLALGRSDGPPAIPPWFHFGFQLPDPDSVRAFRDRMRADGVTIVGEWDEPFYVSFKCLDPDGYVVEVAWEVPQPQG
jgi:catechol 2,3-dioxygenase-like lactoylglutathione lyase family enzyme